MNDRGYNNTPWDQDIYETGRTRPPKNYGGLIAVLLVVVILLSGVISVLGFLNVKLFNQLKQAGTDSSESFSIVSHEEDSIIIETIGQEPEMVMAPTEGLRASIDLNPSPDSYENILQEGGLSLQQIYEQAIDSVVAISCTLPGGSTTGTGVILSSDGYIVTNAHVVEDAQAITVLLTDQRSFDAQLVGSDAVSDLAVLHIEAEDLDPAELGDSDTLRVGDMVVAIGNPLGMELMGTMTDGIISAINRDVVSNGRTMTLIQTNAAMNSGNSGGPLINCYGQVIGINTMKIGTFTDKAGVEGIGFAIPSTTVKEIVEQLLEQGYVSGRPTLGITGEGVSPFYQYYYRMPSGLYISQVDSTSSASLAGIEAGDILISINGTRISSQEDLDFLLYAYEVGATVQAIIYRSGRQYSVNLTLTEAKG